MMSLDWYEGTPALDYSLELALFDLKKEFIIFICIYIYNNNSGLSGYIGLVSQFWIRWYRNAIASFSKLWAEYGDRNFRTTWMIGGPNNDEKNWGDKPFPCENSCKNPVRYINDKQCACGSLVVNSMYFSSEQYRWNSSSNDAGINELDKDLTQ